MGYADMSAEKQAELEENAARYLWLKANPGVIDKDAGRAAISFRYWVPETELDARIDTERNKVELKNA